MLKSLSLKNFTVFPEANLNFGRHLNVIVGENGLGKTHLLKAAYCLPAVSSRGEKESGGPPTKTYLQTAIATKLQGVFKPDELGRLARRQAGRNRCEVSCQFEFSKFDLDFSFHTSSKKEVAIEKSPAAWSEDVPVYLPTRELLTIYPGFISLYETTHLEFEETWRDTAILLGAPLTRGPRETKIRQFLEPLEAAMDGTVELDAAGRFYIKMKTGRFEMHLVAEGLRKLATIARLIANGSLLDKGYLFWDEPEANLNPKLVKLAASTILNLSQNGIQVFIATHSLFLLRELHILQQTEFTGLDTCCFGLHQGDDNAVYVEQGPTMDDIGDITALDEDLMQSERYIDTELGASAPSANTEE